MGTLDGKSALVTGAGRGIGREIALKLGAEGARVVANDIDEKPAAQVAREISDRGGRAVAFAADAADPSFGEDAVDAALKAFGDVDIIVNNAGYIWNTAIQNTVDEQWYAMMDVHATAPFRVLRAAYPHFKEAAAKDAAAGNEVFRKVVNISSVSGLYGSATQIAYSAAKASLVGVTRTLAKEWGRFKVNVNCVAFGFIDTRLTQRYEDKIPTIEVKGRDYKVGLNAGTVEQMQTLIPLGRPGKPREAAGAVYMFCIPESDYVSGQVLVCGGGLIM